MSFVPGMTGIGSATRPRPRQPLTGILKIGHTLADETATIAWPLGHKAGDLVLFHDAIWVESNGNNPTSVVPVGFTTIVNSVGNSGEIDAPDLGKSRVILSYRILDGTEPADGFVTGMVGNRREPKVMLLFRGNVRIRSVTPNVPNVGFLTGVAHSSVKTVNLSSVVKPVVSPVLVYAFHAVNTLPTFTDVNPAFNETINGGGGRSIYGYRVWNGGSTPVNQSVGALYGGTAEQNYGSSFVSGFLQLA